MLKKKKITKFEEISILSSSVNIKGDLSLCGNLRLEGKLEGNLRITGDLTTLDSTRIKGDMSLRNLYLAGEVYGNVDASGKVVLSSSARLEGDVSSSLLIVEKGARFSGKSSMKGVDSDKKIS